MAANESVNGTPVSVGGGGGAPTGAAGGDLAGTYPNPTIAATIAGPKTIQVSDAGAATAPRAATFGHVSSVTTTPGVGVELGLQASNSTPATVDAASVRGILTTTTAASEVGALQFLARTSGAPAVGMQLSGAGGLSIGTVAGVDAGSGNILLPNVGAIFGRNPANNANIQLVGLTSGSVQLGTTFAATILSGSAVEIGGTSSVALSTGAGANALILTNASLMLGSGDATATPATGTFRGANATGTNIAGATLQVKPGLGTGSATAGNTDFFYGPAGSSGTAQNTATLGMRFFGASGGLALGGLTTDPGAGNLGLPNTGGCTTTRGGAYRAMAVGSSGLIAFGNSSDICVFNGGGLYFKVAGGTQATIASGVFQIGAGDGTGAPSAAFLRGASAVGTNLPGTDINIEPGNATGTGIGGNTNLYYVPAGSSGSAAGTYTQAVRVYGGSGGVFIGATPSDPGVGGLSVSGALSVGGGTILISNGNPRIVGTGASLSVQSTASTTTTVVDLQCGMTAAATATAIRAWNNVARTAGYVFGVGIGTSYTQNFGVTFDGVVALLSTDSSGTPGAATINQASGTSAIAIGASSVVITNSCVRAGTKAFAVINQAAEDTTFKQIVRCDTSTAGQITFSGLSGVNATAAVKFSWFLVGT